MSADGPGDSAGGLGDVVGDDLGDGRRYADAEACVEAALSRVGKRVVLGTPLGLGKGNHLVNAFYRRAKADPGLDLTIVTALTLTRPTGSAELERRLVEPLADRLFGAGDAGYPELAYAADRRRGELPANIEVREFYYPPGSLLGNPTAQQSHISSNYSFVVRDLLDLGVNVLCQMVGAEEVDGEERLSLSSNPDLTLDLLRLWQEVDWPVARLAQVNRRMPFMYGAAMVAPEAFDAVLDGPGYEFELPSTPNMPIATADYLIATYASALVKDNGTLQLGIGSLGDAIAYLLSLRHRDNALWRQVLGRTGALEAWGGEIDRLGGTEPFSAGLYGATEMLVDGFLQLYEAGILKRRAYPSADLQRRGDAGDTLSEEEMASGRLVHSGFFLGPRSFYQAIREMPREERRLIEMTAISFVNELYGEEEELKRMQRRNARFLNSGLKATLLGAVASETLSDGRVVSGVGGQYNFVRMAHELADGRSILMVRAVRESGGKVESNVVFSQANCTIPRHLRDVVITEYGIADLRGKTDAQCVAAMLDVADSRFQESLMAEAKRAKKLPRDHVIADRHRRNLPERLETVLAPYRERGMFGELPFGSDLTDEEVVLGKALKALKGAAEGRKRDLLSGAVLGNAVSVPEAAGPYLRRMGLGEPKGMKERAMARVVAAALGMVGIGDG